MSQPTTDSLILAELKRLMFKDKPWFEHCEIIPDYMPPYPGKETRPRLVIRYNSGSEHPPFLRYSVGPLQGYFWDLYGEDFQTEALALLALYNAPPPRSVDPIRFTITPRDKTEFSS